MKILVNCKGFIGDILFASSLAKKLKEKYGSDTIVDYWIPLIQPKLLLEQNPYINGVFGPDSMGLLVTLYNLIIDIPEVNQAYPATIWMQAHAGIEDQSTEFDVWTVYEHDRWAWRWCFDLFPPRPYLAIQRDWAWKAYQSTEETLANGIGAPHRNTDDIVATLKSEFTVIDVGFDRSCPSTHPDAQDSDYFSKTASVIKHCDYFIGSEGGLSNLAAAVGTKCIITTDFIYQNYGPNGRIKQIENPMMGPAIYYPDAGHVHLDPCLTDDEILSKIREIITNETTTH